jgi:PAS domain S-box-containing protein
LLGGFTLDITERKRAEEALRESAERMRAVFEGVLDGILVTSLQGEILDCNDTFVLLLGRDSKEELLGLNSIEMIVEDGRAQVIEDVRGALETSYGGRVVERQVVRKDGSVFDGEVGTAFLRDAEGNPAGCVVGVRDITARKRAEEALHESEQRFRTLAEASFEGIALTEKGVVVDLNDQMAHMLGYARDEMIGRPVMEAVAPESRDFVAEAIRSGRLEPYEHLALRKDGTVFPVEVRARTTQIAGRQLRVSAIRDITERKRVEQERERLIAELEARNAELEQFAYTVSHDLRSPLVTIQGFLGYLEKDAVSGRLDRFRADLGRIDAATNKMQRLLAELLELSRIGRMMNPPQEASFEQIVREAVELAHGRIEACGVQVEIASNLPAVYGDRARLVEVVQNLVDNACKFMGEQPRPRIEIGASGADADGKPIFYVRDNGMGIEPQYHEKIFGLFNKLDAQVEGTGVGLALVKRIVQVHGGRIWVESELGQGTAFYFTVPVNNG